MSEIKRPDIDFLRRERPHVVDQYICSLLRGQRVDGMELEDLDQLAKLIVYTASRVETYRYNLELKWLESQMQEPENG